MSPPFAAGCLLVGMPDLDRGRNRKFVLKWGLASSLFLVSLLFGVITL